MTEAQEEARKEYLETLGYNGEIEFMFNGFSIISNQIMIKRIHIIFGNSPTSIKVAEKRLRPVRQLYLS